MERKIKEIIKPYKYVLDFGKKKTYEKDYFRIQYFSKEIKNNIFNVCLIEDFFNDEVVLFEKIHGKKGIKELLNSIIIDIKKEKYNRFYDSIYYYAPNIMSNALKNDIAYHICDNDNPNDNTINQIGLIANYHMDNSVFQASMLLDKNKPSTISSEFFRSNSIYLMDELYSCKFETNKYMKNKKLYAIDISKLDYYIGSSDIGGFLLFFPDNYKNNKVSPYYAWENDKETQKWIKLYWNNFFSKKDFKSNNKKIISAEKKFAIDEILVQHRILPEFIVQIGRWDEDGIFIPTTSFSHFVLNKYKNKYKEILLNYRFSSMNKKD